ncbi:hypothetical protein NB689_001668 [Xanthomonas sacchari]|nr:hypothetical protein [Xanthomonas sacchari]
MVLYLPKKRSASQPPSSGKKYTPIMKLCMMCLASASRPGAVTSCSSSEVIRNCTRMLRIP